MIDPSTLHPWSVEALVVKAKTYVEKMEKADGDNWEYGFWAVLSIELLARAALSHHSKAYLADSKDWRNVMFAIEGESTSKRANPISIGTQEVLTRLADLEESFTNEIRGYCAQFIDRRNAELHTGEAVFVSLSNSEWLPKFYKASQVLLEIVNLDMEYYFSDVNTVKSYIEALDDKAAKEVLGDIKAYQKVWNDKSKDDKEKAHESAEILVTRNVTHVVHCPACNNKAKLNGTRTGPVTTTVSGDFVEQKRRMVPSSFECIACGLKISGYSKLAACNLANTFTETNSYTAADYFELYTQEEIDQARDESNDQGMEPDFND